jgi:hypothetical protein
LIVGVRQDLDRPRLTAELDRQVGDKHQIIAESTPSMAGGSTRNIFRRAIPPDGLSKPGEDERHAAAVCLSYVNIIMRGG